MHVSIDATSAVPPGVQLRLQLAEMIVGGMLPSNTRLPSVRQLAADLKVAPGTVARVYRDLEVSGHVETSKTGTHVAALGEWARVERQRHLEHAASQFAASSHRAGVRLSDALAAVRRAYRELPRPS